MEGEEGGVGGVWVDKDIVAGVAIEGAAGQEEGECSSSEA